MGRVEESKEGAVTCQLPKTFSWAVGPVNCVCKPGLANVDAG